METFWKYIWALQVLPLSQEVLFGLTHHPHRHPENTENMRPECLRILQLIHVGCSHRQETERHRSLMLPMELHRLKVQPVKSPAWTPPHAQKSSHRVTPHLSLQRNSSRSLEDIFVVSLLPAGERRCSKIPAAAVYTCVDGGSNSSGSLKRCLKLFKNTFYKETGIICEVEPLFLIRKLQVGTRDVAIGGPGGA